MVGVAVMLTGEPDPTVIVVAVGCEFKVTEGENKSMHTKEPSVLYISRVIIYITYIFYKTRG